MLMNSFRDKYTDSRSRLVGIVWGLLFLNTLSYTTVVQIIPFPRRSRRSSR